MNSKEPNSPKIEKRYPIIRVLKATLLIILLITLIQAVFTWRSINDEMCNRERIETNVRSEKVDFMKESIANVVFNSARGIESVLDSATRAEQLLLSMVRDNPSLLGAALAYVPGFHTEKGRLYAPYVFRQDSVIRKKCLKYDYTHYDWYTNPLNTKKAGWCEPYTDADGTYVAMITYSVPLFDAQGRVAAVLTGDLAMSELLILTDNIYHRGSLRSIMILFMQMFALVLIALIGWVAVSSTRKNKVLDDQNHQISDELAVASRLQSMVLPSICPQHPRLSLCASLIPALKVSGDFYDYTLQGDKFSFCIGDVATRGMEAAMAMTVTRTAYRVSLHSDDSLSVMMKKMNHALVGINENYMYATFFAGQLDLSTGCLSYCNAGHFPPFILSENGAEAMNVTANVPLGIVDWQFEQQQVWLKPGDMVFLYTDGVVEAMGDKREPFGEKRMKLRLKGLSGSNRTPKSMIKSIEMALRHHIGMDNTAEDDITMLAFTYL